MYKDVLRTLDEHACLNCHNSSKKEGGIDISTYDGMVRVLKPGHANQSLLVHATQMTMMPPPADAPPLFPEDLELLEAWIDSGAPEKTFSDIRKILKDYACANCHRPPRALGDVDLSSYEEVIKNVVAGDPDGSRLLSSVKIKAMPLDRKVPRLHAADVNLINEWINAGAPQE